MAAPKIKMSGNFLENRGKEPPFFQSFALDFSGITCKFSVSICEIFVTPPSFFFNSATIFPKKWSGETSRRKKARFEANLSSCKLSNVTFQEGAGERSGHQMMWPKFRG